MIITKIVKDPHEAYLSVKNSMDSEILSTFEMQPQLGNEVSYNYDKFQWHKVLQDFLSSLPYDCLQSVFAFLNR